MNLTLSGKSRRISLRRLSGTGARLRRHRVHRTSAKHQSQRTRLKSADEFGKRNLAGDGFGGSLVRQCLFAVAHSAKTEDPREDLNYLKTELNDYWIKRERIIHVLDYLTALRGVTGMEHWSKDAHAASLLTGMVRNDHVCMSLRGRQPEATSISQEPASLSLAVILNDKISL